MKAYYFSTISKTLRYGDGRVIEEGITHSVEGTPVLCKHGLHASKRAIDALHYAPGSYLWIVELSGEIVEGDDKVVATERTYIKGFDATNILREFSRKVALINIEKIKPYCFVEDFDIIIRYLETGDEELRSAARAAAESARAAAESARAAERAAAASAARAAARAAAASAAWSAAASAAWSAAASAASAMNKMLEEIIEEELKEH